jgi:Flp pilus assembly pilin Flp
VTLVLTIANRCFNRADGQDLLEYALLSALIALVAFAGVTSVGNAVGNVLWTTIAQNF